MRETEMRARVEGVLRGRTRRALSPALGVGIGLSIGGCATAVTPRVEAIYSAPVPEDSSLPQPKPDPDGFDPAFDAPRTPP